MHLGSTCFKSSISFQVFLTEDRHHVKYHSWKLYTYKRRVERKWVLNCIKKFYTLQIEENTKQMYSDSQGQHSSAVSDPRRRSSGWKVGARNALLQWCKEIITPKFGIHVENFGSSWRDGRAFVALISALNPGM